MHKYYENLKLITTNFFAWKTVITAVWLWGRFLDELLILRAIIWKINFCYLRKTIVTKNTHKGAYKPIQKCLFWTPIQSNIFICKVKWAKNYSFHSKIDFSITILVTYRIRRLYKYTSKLGPGAAREKFNELTSPIWTFYVTQSFLSRDPFVL